MRVRYRWGQNLDVAHIELREKMDLLKSFFPREVKRPIILQYDPSQEAFAGIAVSSGSMDNRSLYLLCKQDIQGFLERTDGISHVSLLGGQRPEVQILITPEKLVKYNISITEIKNILGLSNKNFGVGYFHNENHEYLVRINGEITGYKDLESIVLNEEDKRLVLLKDLATVIYGVEEKKSDILIDGQHALMLSFHKKPGFNILKASKEIDRKIDQLQERYEGRVYFHKVFDESDTVERALKDLVWAMLLGIFFTVVSVFVFLSNLKVSMLIISTIPLSFTATFIIMRIFDLSINLLTLGGFSLAVGMIVDNSVIVVSSVIDTRKTKTRYNEVEFYRRLGKVVPAVISATFTTVVVFFPVLFLRGILRLIFLQLSLVVIVSLLFSLLFALTAVPVVLPCLNINEKSKTVKILTAGATGPLYERMLRFVFKRQYLFFALLAVLFLAGIFSYTAVDKRFLESIPQNYFFLKIFIPQQVPFEYTAQFSDQVSRVIKHERNIERIIAAIGADKNDLLTKVNGIQGVNTAVLKVYTGEKGREMYSQIASIREKLAVFPGVDFLFSIPDNPVQRLLSRSEYDIVVKIFDPSPEYLAKKSGEISAFLRERGLAEDVLNTYYMTNSERAFEVKRKESSIFKVDAPFIGEFITSAVSGLKVGTLKKDEYEIPILLRIQRDSFSGVGDLLNFSIKNREGKEIRLDELLTLKEVAASNLILRENQNAYAKVEFNLENERGHHFFSFRRLERVREIEDLLESLSIDYQYTDQFSLLRENYREILLALFLAVFLEYTILASGFKSFLKPLLVIAMIPLSIPGIFLILALIGSSLNINTFMSIIVLIGLMVNNAIMLFLQYQNSAARKKNDIITASVQRLQPILITTLSTILALVPILFTGNRIQVNLASTLILGLLYSTGVTLFYLPMLYAIFHVKQDNEE
jgi:multidrug efflux pump subunit AcrB